jgi:hypothetical protein
MAGETPIPSREWVAKAEAAVLVAEQSVKDARDSYFEAVRNKHRVQEVAGNRRAALRGDSYEPFPGIGQEL